MRALQLTGYGGNDRLRLTELPRPEPGPGEVLIRVHCAGLNPVDWKTRAGQLRAILRPHLPWVMGNEMAGEVVALGGEQLAQIAQRIDDDRLRVDVARSDDLDDYARAFDDLEHETSGKLVLRIAG